MTATEIKIIGMAIFGGFLLGQFLVKEYKQRKHDREKYIDNPNYNHRDCSDL